MRDEPLSKRALGRWPSILSALGVPSHALRNKHGPCPMCGGKDRFRFDDQGGRGTWICSRCGAGDGLALVQRFLRVDFRSAALAAERHMRAAKAAPRHPQLRAPEEQQRELLALWKRSQPISAEDPVGKYLNRRLGLTTFPKVLRFLPRERYLENGRLPSWHPVMLAIVEPSDAAQAAGEQPAFHRTYLNDRGGKADVNSQRKLLGRMPTGAAVRLAPDEDKLGIAEGIETALAASILFGMPVRAATNAALLRDRTPPRSVRSITIFGDNDASAAGQAAAYMLAYRLKAKGVKAFFEIPPSLDEDGLMCSSGNFREMPKQSNAI